MSSRRSPILLTGFGPFPGVPVNVSGRYATALGRAARDAFPSVEFVAAELATEWRSAPRLLEELYFTHRPQTALHFGVSNLAHAMTVECVARNQAHRADAAGDGPELDLLAPDGPAEWPVTLPAGRLVARMQRRSIPAVISHDAGAYLCNAILFHSLELMRTLGIHGQAGFIHLPTRLPKVGSGGGHSGPTRLTFDEAVVGGLEMLSVLVNRPAVAVGGR